MLLLLAVYKEPELLREAGPPLRRLVTYHIATIINGVLGGSL